MLQLEEVNVYYGHIQALRTVSLNVPDGEIYAILGANGAGKSTLLRSVLGLAPYQGRITLQGRGLEGTPAHRRVAEGIALAPEGRRLFSSFSVEENLRMGAYLRNDSEEIEKDIETMYETFPILKSRKNQRAGTLSGGEGQMLAISRALMSRPKLLLMDEPSMGLMPKMVNEIFAMVKNIPDSGVTVLLVEQNAQKALEVATIAAVLELGAVVHEGAPEELAADARVREAYLGA